MDTYIPPSRQLSAPSSRVSYAIKIEYIQPKITPWQHESDEVEGPTNPDWSGFKVTVGDRYESGLTLGEMLEVVIAVTNDQSPRYLRTAHEHYLYAARLNCSRYIDPSPLDAAF